MTAIGSKSLGEQATDLVALVDTWLDAHEAAERDALRQVAAAVAEVRALERVIRARHERYRAELTALRQYVVQIAIETGSSDHGPPRRDQPADVASRRSRRG